MKHIYKLLILVLLSNASGFAQNMGIGGATNPQYPLDVNGRIRIRFRPNEGAGLWFNKPDNTPGTFIGQTSTGNFGIANNSTGTWSFAFDHINTRLGIGTDAPASPVTVKFFGNGIEQVNPSGTVRMSTYVGNTSGILQTITNHPLRFATNDATQAQMTLNTNGALGLGLLNPQHPLSFPSITGNKISLWSTDPTSATAVHYGIGIQGYQFQFFAPTVTDNIVFGIGSSASFAENMRITGDGKVGIGTTNPASLLTIKSSGSSAIGLDHTSLDGNVRLGTYASSFGGAILMTHTNHSLRFSTNGNFLVAGMVLSTNGNVGIGANLPTLGGLVVNTKVGAAHAVFGTNTTGVSIESDYPGVAFNSYYNGGRKALQPGYGGGIGQEPSTGRIYIYGSPSSVGAANGDMATVERLSILPNGNVGIGTLNPTQALAVNGTIRAKEVIVETGWADFVFEPTYRLRPLAEVERFIQTHHHLPDMAPAATIQQNGVGLSDVTTKLMQKVEELTLYMIAQEKKNDRQQHQIRQLQKELKQIRKPLTATPANNR